MAARRRPTEDRRAEIADAALEIIATRGIAALSTSSLAEMVGLTTGALFRHFPSREAILQEVAERAEAVIDRTYPDPRLPPLARLAALIDARTAMAGLNAGIPRLVLSEQFTLALPEDAARRLRGAVGKTRVFVVAALREAQARGEVRGDVPAEDLGVVFVGAMQMIALSAAMGPAAEGGSAGSVRATLMRLLAPPARGRSATGKKPVARRPQ